MSKIAIKTIRFYQYFSKTVLKNNAIPLLFPSVCRFYPSCSDYTINMIAERGFLKGVVGGFLRVIRCNPLTKI